VQWLIHSVQYANPTAIYEGEPAELVPLSNTAYDGQDSNTQSPLPCSELEGLLTNTQELTP